ncbi:MAG: pilin, partial [Gammaproteobacteria bacterium]
LYSSKGTLAGVSIAAMGGTTAGKYVSGVAFSNIDVGTIMVESTLGTGNTAAAILGSSFAIETIDGGRTWKCGANVTMTPSTAQVQAKYMPGSCK